MRFPEVDPLVIVVTLNCVDEVTSIVYLPDATFPVVISKNTLFSSPKANKKGSNLSFWPGESKATKKKLSKLKFNFGKFTGIFKGKNLNKNFNKLKSIEFFNSKLGKVTYQFNKVISGDPNNLKLTNPDKNIIVVGSQYNDDLEGDGGQNKIYGLGGNDYIEVSGSKNLVYGGKGNDILDVRFAGHKLYGGKGKDLFKLSSSAKNVLIADFKDKQDKILIKGVTNKLKLKNKAKDVYIYDGNDLLAKVKKAKGLLSKKGKYLV